VFTPTIFDYLTGAADPISGTPLTWRYFEHAYCTLRSYERHTFDDKNIVELDDPEFGFFAAARSGQLPNVSFIDPHFVNYPPGSDCDEPPSDITDGQEFVRRIAEAVISSPAWHKTLLLIVYDEHGGFYDHVPPPAAAAASDEFPISTLGLRVPALVISPWVTPGSVFGYDSDVTNPLPPVATSADPSVIGKFVGVHGDLHFDHTSILKTIARRFLSDDPPYLGARYAGAKDLSIVVGAQLRQPQFLPFITYRLQFVQSEMMLNATKLATLDPGAVLWQAPAEDSVVQNFSFEDAGDGFVYIRSHVGNQYLTADAPDSVLTSATAGSPAAKWTFSETSISTLHPNLFVISNQAYPNLLLQPANRMSGSPVVLGDPGGTPGIHGGQPNTWSVASPLLTNQHVNTQ
jgi:Phosphoesterase family